MTLLITMLAAVISTIIWYQNAPCDDKKLSVLCFMYWGASLMWLVDAVFAYMELGAAYFTPAFEDMINDAYLGICVTALGLVIWLVNLMITDPQGKMRAVFSHRR